MSEDRFSKAIKLDTNKPPMNLLPWEAITGVSRVLDFGQVKYQPWNWRKGFARTRLAAAGLRHIFSWLSGEDNDPESGLSHIDHATCCLMFLSSHIASNLGKDDRAHILLAEPPLEVKTPEPIKAAEVPAHTLKRYAWFHMVPTYGLSERRSPLFVSTDLCRAYVDKVSDGDEFMRETTADFFKANRRNQYTIEEVEVDEFGRMK